jgi:hypothetical protein
MGSWVGRLLGARVRGWGMGQSQGVVTEQQLWHTYSVLCGKRERLCFRGPLRVCVFQQWLLTLQLRRPGP